MASVGGGIYLSDSILTLSGENSFLNNTSSMYKDNCPWNNLRSNYYGNGGALVGSNSSIAICGYSTFIANSAMCSGGAIASYNGSLSIQGTTWFDKNSASERGGAMILYGMNSTILEHLFIVNNRCNKCMGRSNSKCSWKLQHSRTCFI